MKLYNDKKVVKSTEKKYVSRKFTPKAYYYSFDWENYDPKKIEYEYQSAKVEIKKNLKSDLLVQKGIYSEKEVGDATERTSKKAEKIAVKTAKVQKIEESNFENEKIHSVKTRHSIGLKLIGIISALLSISLVLITILVSYFVSKDTRINAEDNNLTINSRTASDTENRFDNVVSSAGMFIDLLESAGENYIEQKKNAVMFFERNENIATIILPDSNRIFTNTAFIVSHELEAENFENLIDIEEENIALAKNGTIILENISPVFQTPMLLMCYPLYTSNSDSVLLICYSTEDLAESFSSGSINNSFMVNGKGEVLIHSDLDLMMKAADMSQNPIVSQMLESNIDNRQITFDFEGEEYIGAFRKFKSCDGGVITVVKSSIIFEAVKSTTRRNIYLTFAILALSILIIYFFAKTLSTPLKQLTEVTEEINQGNFNTLLLSELNGNRKDEIGVLIKSTKNEQNILNTFTKLTNKGVTRAIIRKEIDFEPHLKDITIFFSDIRGFTAISDGFKNRFGEQSAAEIIGFLNDYMSRMVNCIKITGGNVDKFEGDAIMACWGVLREDSLAYETMSPKNPDYAKLKNIHDSHVKNDALGAIQATIAMRYSLAKYNKDAEEFSKLHEGEPLAKYKPHIRIGSGLNSGRATVGFMGSDDKMEFTSIGDAVNLASRTEASNKPCGTDILITEDTYNILKFDYIRCEENNFTISPKNEEFEIIVEVIPVTFEVKGKGKQHFYGVVNMPNFDIEKFFKQSDPDFIVDEDCSNVIGPKGPKNLHEVRNLLGIPEPDFGGVNLDEEENKIKIQTS